MSSFFNLTEQFHLGPTTLKNRLDVPMSLFHGQFCLQDNHILCPSNQ